MPLPTRIPPLLQPSIQLPRDDCLILLTSTLGASANWLVIRFLCAALNDASQDGGEEGHNVVLLSWMREYEFWRQEARKGGGLDLDRLRKEGRFAFIDGLSGLCIESTAEDSGAGSNATRIPSARLPQTLPTRGPPERVLGARGAPVQPSSRAAGPEKKPLDIGHSIPGHYALKALDAAHLETTVAGAISSLASNTQLTTKRKTLLVIDNPDLLLALNPTITPSALTSLISHFHTLPTVSHILTQIQSDNPLLSLSTPPQPLQIAQHNFLIKCAHMSRRIIGVRVLDTGVARDVSGVVRITEQKADWLQMGFDNDSEVNEESTRGKEFLYQVKGDGSVRVFERGAGGDG